MDARTLRLLVADARETGVTSLSLSVRQVEDMADQIEYYEKALKKAAKTLRDEFAMFALNQRKMIATGAWYADDAAREAYDIADAMMKARGQ